MAMWDKSDYENINNIELKECYKEYLESLDALAVFYAISKEATVNYAKINGIGKKFFLSNDFHEVATTIITDYEAITLIKNNTYLTYLKEDFVIRLCSIFEDFINKILNILNVDTKKATSFNSYSKVYNLTYQSDSVVFRKIYYIIDQLSLNTLIFKNDAETLKMLDQVVVIRNVLIHFNGKITKKNHNDIIRDLYKDNENNIKINDNTIDDFLHRFTINIYPLIRDIDENITKQSSQ